MANRRKVGNPLALTLLSQLTERPMYPYELAQTLRRRGKDQSVRINWGSLYTVVQNLEKHGFIEAVDTGRSGRQPERTTYRITEAGRAELTDWLRELLSVPKPQYPPLQTALSEAGALHPDDVAELLGRRLAVLDESIAKMQQELDTWSAKLPRLFLIENEFQLAMHRAEADWVRGLVREIAEGTLPGVAEWRRVHETGEFPEDLIALDRQIQQEIEEGGERPGRRTTRNRPGRR